MSTPAETKRKFVKKLSSERVRETYAKWVLKRWAGENNFSTSLREGFPVAPPTS